MPAAAGVVSGRRHGSAEPEALADGLPRGTERCWMVRGWKYRFGIHLGKPPSITLDSR